MVLSAKRFVIGFLLGLLALSVNAQKQLGRYGMDCGTAVQEDFKRYSSIVLYQSLDSTLTIDTSASYMLKYESRCYQGPSRYSPPKPVEVKLAVCESGACQPKPSAAFARKLYTVHHGGRPAVEFGAAGQPSDSLQLFPRLLLGTRGLPHVLSFANGKYVVMTSYWTEADIHSRLPDSWQDTSWWERVEE